jgi:hypothetical protein
MKYLKDSNAHRDADSADDLIAATQLLEQRVTEFERRLATLPRDAVAERIDLQIELGNTLVDLERGAQAFDVGREAFDAAVRIEDWERAVLACAVMFNADVDDSLAALGQGVWLAVTFPVDPELTVAMLQHVVEETPDDSDGAAIAATVAHYVADLRAKDKLHDDLMFFTNGLLGTVARRHGKVNSQEQFDYWYNKLELGDPQKFLPRLRNVIDVMVQNDWWLDREAIWAKLPVN